MCQCSFPLEEAQVQRDCADGCLGKEILQHNLHETNDYNLNHQEGIQSARAAQLEPLTHLQCSPSDKSGSPQNQMLRHEDCCRRRHHQYFGSIHLGVFWPICYEPLNSKSIPNTGRLPHIPTQSLPR
mmetsp:Transcript_57333/g.134165  ORF Transcript_57333/g.134165 Transcript_57333/m.134165 type:complete len:127 (-) Transcript_57333:1814-2194(-)